MPGVPGIWGANQYATFTQEVISAWGTYDGSATVKPVIEIEPGGLNITRTPITKEGRVATANIPGRRVSSRYEVKGTLKTKMFPELMVPFISWMTPQVVSGRMTLPSFTADWFDGNEARRFRGNRITDFTAEFNADELWGMVTINFQGRDQDSATPTMSSPLVTAYPKVAPSLLPDSVGFCSFNGSTLASYRSFKVTVKNILDPQWDELTVLNSLEYCGRDVDAEFVGKLTATTRKTLYEAQTPVASLFKWQVVVTGSPNVTYTTIFDLQGTCYLTNRTPERAFERTQYETIAIKPFRDVTSGTDLVMTSTAV